MATCKLRNIGIVGYVGVFLVVAALLADLFYRARPQGPEVHRVFHFRFRREVLREAVCARRVS